MKMAKYEDIDQTSMADRIQVSPLAGGREPQPTSKKHKAGLDRALSSFY